MRLYVAGPMRGRPESNFPAFEDAARRLRLAGYDVVSPHEGSPTDDPDPPEAQYQELIRRGVRLMLNCDGVAVLDGWRDSGGASFEVDVATGARKPVREVGEWLALGRGDVPTAQHQLPLLWKGEASARPVRQYGGDAGFDLVCSETTAIGYKSFVDVPCGVSIALPELRWALIIGRSSTLRKRQLMVAPGIIDQGWRGPLFAGVWNLGETRVEVKEGDRIAQLIPFPLTAAGLRLEHVEELPPGDRGTRGFGSTGE